MSLFSKYSKSMGVSRAIPLAIKLFGAGIKYSFYRHVGYPKILPRIIRFNITNLCDSRCKTCFIWDYYRKYPGKLKEEATFSELKQFIEKNLFIEDIILTGGQVTLRKDIIDMWLYLDKKGYRTGGPTNSVNLKRIKKVRSETLEKLSGKNIHSMIISIDGIGEEHDRIRGVKGEFKNALSLLNWGLDKQKEFNFLDVGISHNITPSNYKNFPEFLDYFFKLGLKPSQVTFRVTSPLEAYQNIKSKEIGLKMRKKEEIEKLINVLNSVRKKYREYNDYFVRGTIKFFRSPHKLVIPCNAAFFICYIDPYWNVYPCYNMYTKIGNLRENGFDLRQFWNSKKIKDIQDTIKKGKCPNCWTRCFSGYSMISNPLRLMGLSCEIAYKFLFKKTPIYKKQ